MHTLCELEKLLLFFWMKTVSAENIIHFNGECHDDKDCQKKCDKRFPASKFKGECAY